MHVLSLEGRHGAGDESSGSDFAGDGEVHHLVASGGIGKVLVSREKCCVPKTEQIAVDHVPK
ncbi:MAG: hypothetical protein DMG72_13470 [Acidobacteria bacterium]|nr:MAG: hypothetical protein DMG72_13470 [Acidobacteriota bacterium]